jgi:ABC-type enterochelin transport system permease subunit
MKKDRIKKIISKAHSAFDGFSILLLSSLIFFFIYIGILRIMGTFSYTMRAIVAIGILFSVLVFMLWGFIKGGKTRQGIIVMLIGVFIGMLFMSFLRYLSKMF